MIRRCKETIISINEKFTHCQTSPKLAEPIKKLQYAIKVTLKNVQNIKKYINADVNPETSKTTPKKRKFSEITPPEKNLQFIAPDFNNLESHPVGTPITTKTLSRTPRIGSSGKGDKYGFLFTNARFGRSGYGGDNDDDDPKGNKKDYNKKNLD